MRYCSNFKCKLWQPLGTSLDDYKVARSLDREFDKPSIVGRCTCCGAASGDCLRCGGV